MNPITRPEFRFTTSASLGEDLIIRYVDGFEFLRELSCCVDLRFQIFAPMNAIRWNRQEKRLSHDNCRAEGDGLPQNGAIIIFEGLDRGRVVAIVSPPGVVNA